MNKDETITKLKETIQDLLEALDAPNKDSCDCGGSSMCAVCNAYGVLKEVSSGVDMIEEDNPDNILLEKIERLVA